MALAVGCAPAEPEGTENETTETSSGTSTTQESGGTQLVEFRNEAGNLVCPLMNSEIKDESKVISWVEHEGTKYAMCCDACAEKGKEDPALVAEKAAAL